MKFEDLFGNAKWISPDSECLTPDFRTIFSVKSPETAEITICGLGFFEAYLNGKRIGNDIFVPLNTNYFERPITVNGRCLNEKMGSRIISPKYDISSLIKDGDNVLCVKTGPGYYNYDHTSPFGNARLCFRINIKSADGESAVVSDESVMWHISEIVISEFTRGEDHDYNLEPHGWLEAGYDMSGWENTAEAPVPDTEYLLQSSPADRIIRTIKPSVIAENDKVRVYDIGENLSGRPLVIPRCSEKCKIRLRFAEEKTPDGFIDEKSFSDMFGQHLNITTDGRQEAITSRFTWFGARYIEITKPAEIIGFEEIHADVKVTSAFTSSNDNLNWLYEAYIRTQLSNMHGGIPSDCPHIERRGYTGDGQLTCETSMTLIGAESFYCKWIDDISDCQDRISGHVQYTAPFVYSGGGPGGWGCAIVEVPYIFWKIYGDFSAAENMYPGMLKYFDYLEAHSENGLITSDEPDYWCLGDWCTADKTVIPEAYVNNYFYIKSMLRVAEIAEKLNQPETVGILQKRIFERKSAMYNIYYDESTGSFFKGIQGADAFAVDIGLGDSRTFENLVNKYDALGMYDTGIFGTDILTRVLFEKGNGELALKLLSGDGKYSFANWKMHGSTTLWEYWTGERSHSHPMFGAVTRYLFNYILGIRQRKGSTAFEDIIIAPSSLPSLESACGSIETKSGNISVSRIQYEKKIRFGITIDGAVKAVLLWKGRQYPLDKGENTIEFLL